MKKQMLNEGEIRKMMKFANIKNLTENFLETKLDEEAVTEEDTLEEGEDEKEETLEEEAVTEEETLEEEAHEEELELDADPMGEEPPMDDELPMGDEPAAAPAGNEEIAKQLAAGVAALLSQVLDVDVESTDDGMADEPALDEPELPEPALEAPPEEEPVMEMGHEKDELSEMGDHEDDTNEGDMYQEDLVNEITRRVAKRLLDINKK